MIGRKEYLNIFVQMKIQCTTSGHHSFDNYNFKKIKHNSSAWTNLIPFVSGNDSATPSPHVIFSLHLHVVYNGYCISITW